MERQRIVTGTMLGMPGLHPLELAHDALVRVRNAERLRLGSEAYAELIERIRRDRLGAEVFQFPFLLDDRLRRSAGAVSRSLGTNAR